GIVDRRAPPADPHPDARQLPDVGIAKPIPPRDRLREARRVVVERLSRQVALALELAPRLGVEPREPSVPRGLVPPGSRPADALAGDPRQVDVAEVPRPRERVDEHLQAFDL